MPANRRLSFWITVIIFILVTSSRTTAQQDSSIVFKSDLKISAFPIAFYTPETAFGFGGIGISTFHFLGERLDSRPSSIQVGISYTTKKQFLLYLPFELYADDELWKFEGELGFYKYFYNFYGIGIESDQSAKESYAVSFPRTRLSAFRQIFPYVQIGFSHELDLYYDLGFEEGGTLDSADVGGKKDATISSLGIRANYDSRDNIFSPTKGLFVQGGYFISRKELGSDFNYSKWFVDSRYFTAIYKKQILAINLFVGHTGQGTPFYHLNYLGSNRSRGLDDRRFQDHSELSVATEYRFPIAGSFGAVAFAGIGTVGEDIAETLQSKLIPTGGLGIRYLINKRDGINVRADYGISSEGGRLYITIKEAF